MIKKRDKTIILIIIALFFLMQSCDFCSDLFTLAFEREPGDLYIINKSDHDIGYYAADGHEDGTFYPDSLPLTNIYVFSPLEPNSKDVLLRIWGLSTWRKFFEDYLPHDTLSVFIFHSDTLNKYSWDEVRDGYKILKRYDLSLDDFRRMDYTLTYP